MEIMYIAYDGTGFKNEKECDDYEKEHNKYIEDYGKYLYCEDIENNKIDLSKKPSFGVYMPTDTGDWEYNHDVMF